MPTYDAETIRTAGWPVYKMAVLKRLDRWTARATRPLFIAISESVKRSAVRNLGLLPADVRVIYNSIDQKTLACDPEEPRRIRQEAGIPAQAFVYLTVGRLSPEKGQSVLLRAFKEVAAAIPDAYLVFAGEGPLAAAHETLASELGIRNRVRFSAAVPMSAYVWRWPMSSCFRRCLRDGEERRSRRCSKDCRASPRGSSLFANCSWMGDGPARDTWFRGRIGDRDGGSVSRSRSAPPPWHCRSRRRRGTVRQPAGNESLDAVLPRAGGDEQRQRVRPKVSVTALA